jgi:hypothetical protein
MAIAPVTVSGVGRDCDCDGDIIVPASPAWESQKKHLNSIPEKTKCGETRRKLLPKNYRFRREINYVRPGKKD